MTAFQPAVHQQLVVDGVVYSVSPHPQNPTLPYVVNGREHQLVQLQTAGGFVALKVVRPPLAASALSYHAAQIEPLAGLAGLQVARRMILDPQHFPALIAAQPQLAYAVLMPWVYGPSWLEVIRTRRAISPDQGMTAARYLASLLADLERRGLAHGDLQSGNLMMPGLDVQSTTPIALVDLEQLHGNSVDDMPFSALPATGYTHQALGMTLGPLRDRFAGAVLLAELIGWSEAEVRSAAAAESFFDPADLHQNGTRAQVLRNAVQRRAGPSSAALFDRAWQSALLNQCPRFTEWNAVLNGGVSPTASGEFPSAAASAPTAAYVAAPAAPSAEATQRLAGPPAGNQSAPTQAFSTGPVAGSTPPVYGAPASPAAEATAALPAASAAPAAEATAAVSFETLAGFAQSLRAQGRIAEAVAALRHALSTLPPGDPRAPRWQAELQQLVAQLPAATVPVPTQQSAAPASGRPAWLLPLLGGLLALLLLGAGGAAFLFSSAGSPSGAATPTTQATQSGAAVLPTRAPTGVPTATAIPLIVAELAPAELYTGDGQLSFVVRGSGLDEIKDAALIADGLRLPLTIGSGSTATELLLSLDALPPGVSGVLKAALELNGQIQSDRVVVLRDFLEERQAIGILKEYIYTGRITEDAAGPSASIHESADANSLQTGLLRNTDIVQILSTAAEGWYKVRIAVAADDPTRVGQVGFIERWIIDNSGAPTPPPTNTPAPSRRLRFIKLNENDSPNCVSVGISGVNTNGWSFTIDGTDNTGRFDSGGNARVCGLGAQQEVTLTVRDGNGRPVPGGVGVPTRGSAIMGATWQ